MFTVVMWFYMLGAYTIGPYADEAACQAARRAHVDTGAVHAAHHQGPCFRGLEERALTQGGGHHGLDGAGYSHVATDWRGGRGGLRVSLHNWGG